MHSFSGIPLPHEPDQAPDRAEVCIGFDDFHSAFERDLDLLGLCNRYGFEGSVNRPFSGSIVPSAFWNQEAKVRSFMIELRRDLYMDEQTGRKRDDFCAVSIKVCELLRELSQTK